MAENGDVLELLRSRLADLETRQRSSGGASATDFWQRLTSGMPSGPSAPDAPPATGGSTGSDSSTATASGSAVGSSGGSASRGRRASRRVAPDSRPVTTAHGPWSGLPTDALNALDPLDLLDGLDPWLVEPLSEADWHAMVQDPDWIEATATRAAASPDTDCSRVDTQHAIDIDAVLGRPLTGHPDTALTAAAERVAQQRRTHEVTLVTILSELLTRGVDTPEAMTPTDWLRTHDTTLTAAQARAFVTVARAMPEPRWARLRRLLTTQQVTVGNAAQIIDFHTRTAPLADPDELTTALDDLTDQARQLRPEELARLTRHHTEQITPPPDEDALDRGRRQARGLWFTPPNATGMVAMRATLDPEGAAILKSAIDPLAAPHPERDEHGHTLTADDRTPARRRIDALLTIVQRGVASADGVPTTDKAKVVVLIDLDTLLTDPNGTGHPSKPGADIPDAFRRTPTSRTGGGACAGGGGFAGAGASTGAGGIGGRTRSGTGITLSGDVLSPGVVRRMACDAQIIPMVLGGDSKPLDLARRRRLFTRSQRLALAVRDKGCSWQGCTTPPSWCDAHHVTHWAFGGPTNLLNAALLCPRHHTHVHHHGLTATVTDTGVTWHT